MTEIDSRAKICPQCHKRQSHLLESVLGGILLIMIISITILLVIMEDSTKNNVEDKCYITLEEFNQIQNGMTYTQVKEIVGCDGVVNSDTELMGSRMTIYSWYGKDDISNANVTIQNDKLISKAQIGLK